ncbi:unnamed protein product [Dovyalis caffra]|uniref:Uncharacterized protein n=1 Tax=Dovyalis caffra TaxID=77055 RepID=A0AAV1SK90_9ROSI|nr:unnamed protein product [Dovyalis caffra]
MRPGDDKITGLRTRSAKVAQFHLKYLGLGPRIAVEWPLARYPTFEVQTAFYRNSDAIASYAALSSHVD